MEKIFNLDFIEPCNANCSFCFLNYADELGRNYLFRNLTPSEIGSIIREVHHQVKEFRQGDVIAYAGEIYDRLQIIVKGSVVGEIVDFEGRALRIEELKAPDTIASAFIFGDDNSLPVNITAVDDVRLLIINKSDLLKLFRKYEPVLHNYLDIMANRAQHLSKKIKMFGFQTIKGKIAHYLLDLMKSGGSETFRIPNTQEEMARIFGVARPSLTRVLRELHNEGYIRLKGKEIQIINKPGLSKLLK